MDFTDPNTPHDRVICVEEKKFYIYSGHLSFCSEFFRTMFTSDFKEKNQEEIKIGELVAEDFHAFLQTLIPGNTTAITVDNYLLIMACARRFMAPHVLVMCEQFTFDNFDKLDKIELLKMAFEYNWNKLIDKLSAYLVPTTQQGNCCILGCFTEVINNYCSNCGAYVDPIKQPIPLDKTSYLVQNKEKLLILPAEIHSYILKLLLNEVENR